MTLNEAIEVLDNIISRLSIVEEPDDLKAINLGCEAMKYLQHDREQCPSLGYDFLPGETKE